jgi:putative hydroxymethylpyrimidine transport system permease protein
MIRRLTVMLLGFLLIWQFIVWGTDVPRYILPGPLPVAIALVSGWEVLFGHLLITLTEILLGLILGVWLGLCFALTMTLLPSVGRWMLPLLVISQAIPVFALAPILVLWFGYGMASKIAMAVLIIFFPVASSLYHGMQRVDPGLLELARIMGGSRVAILRYLVIPSALPSFAGGVRIAAAVSPIGAIVGEWVGASGGLGYFMLHANARMQIDKMFAALFLLALVSVTLYFSIDFLLKKLIFWQDEEVLKHENS